MTECESCKQWLHKSCIAMADDTCFIARSATSRSAQRISSADSHLNRSAISGSAVYQQKLDQLSDQLSSAQQIKPTQLK